MISENAVSNYYGGPREGIALYAHWKDGVQYVGTAGKTLKQAIGEIDKREKESPKGEGHYA